MNTHTPRRITENGNDIIITGRRPDGIHLLLDLFNQKEMIEKNPELEKAKFTGYLLLFHIIETLVIYNVSLGNNILEIGGGIYFGLENIKYLRKLTDTVDKHGNKQYHAFGIDLRNGDAIISKVLRKYKNTDLPQKERDEVLRDMEAIYTKAIQSYDWADIGKLTDNTGKPLTFDCIFNHSIGPNPGGYEKVTDAALNPGGYYIAFREKGSVSNEPVDKKFFEDKKYIDYSFSFKFKPGLTSVKKGYDVTIFQKLTESEIIARSIQADTHGLLGGYNTNSST